MVAFVLLFWWLALDSLVMDSPTMDEQNHIARGLAFLRTGDPRLSLEHPPLVNAISALPLLTMSNIRLPLDHPSWERQPPDVYWYVFADLLLWDYNHDVGRILFLARLPVVVLTLGLALAVFRWAWALWGRQAGLLAFALVLFDPNVLAHGRYVTTDLGGTLFLFLATWALWRLWQKPTWGRWLVTAVTLGCAFGSKLSMLGFVPIFALMAFLPGEGQWSWREAGRRLGLYLTAGAAATAVVWAIFGFEWGTLQMPGETFTFLNGLSAPMPTFWAGIAKILTLTSGGRQAYLLGQFSTEGFAAYFPVAFAAKTPLAVLLVLPLAAGWLLWQRPFRTKTLFLLTPPVLYFAVTLASDLNLGYRHLLPMLPFLYIVLVGVVGDSAESIIAKTQRITFTNGSALTLILDHLPLTIFLFLLAAQLLVALSIHPHYLSYFNRAVGGPENGYHILLDSNIDWGQDLLRLQQWMRENGVTEVKLGWFGTAEPAYYAIPHEPLPGFPEAEFLSQWTNPPFNTAAPEPGVYAISVSNLMELPLPESGVYAWFRQRKPDARIGYSIMIYDLR